VCALRKAELTNSSPHLTKLAQGVLGEKTDIFDLTTEAIDNVLRTNVYAAVFCRWVCVKQPGKTAVITTPPVPVGICRQVRTRA